MGVGGKDCFTWNTAPICFWSPIVRVKSGLSLRKFQPGPRCGVRGQRSARPPPRTMADSPHPLPHTLRGMVSGPGAYPTGYGIGQHAPWPMGLYPRGYAWAMPPGRMPKANRTGCPVVVPATRAGRPRPTAHGPGEGCPDALRRRVRGFARGAGRVLPGEGVRSPVGLQDAGDRQKKPGQCPGR